MTVTPAHPKPLLPGLLRVALVGLATARLTRFVVNDWLGEWAIVRPAQTWSSQYEAVEISRRTREIARLNHWKRLRAEEASFDDVLYGAPNEPEPVTDLLPEYDENDPFTWQAKLVKGLGCPFCVGFWIGGAVLAAEAFLGPNTRTPRPAKKLWTLGLGALALNYVVGHLSSKID